MSLRTNFNNRDPLHIEVKCEGEKQCLSFRCDLSTGISECLSSLKTRNKDLDIQLCCYELACVLQVRKRGYSVQYPTVHAQIQKFSSQKH